MGKVTPQHRRSAALIIAAQLSVAAVCFLGVAALADDPTYDLIIENGRLIDGAGNPWIYADIGIKSKKIAAVGDLSDDTAERRIDATGLYAAPGFIDIHSHASWSYLVDSRAIAKVTQGITLEVEGEGFSVAPVDDALFAARFQANLERHGIDRGWRTLAEFFNLLEANPATINFATHIGTANVRVMTVGYEDRAATPGELQEMRYIVDEAMKDGALGVYSALMYVPDRFNRTNELIEMAKVAAQYGGYYQTHPRSESSAWRKSMDEVYRIATEASIPVHVTHLKITHQQNWGKISELIARTNQARENGIAITADLYPYERASSDGLTVLLPPWAQEGGRDRIVSRLQDVELRERIKEELAQPTDEWENEYYGAKGGSDGFTIADAMNNDSLAAYVGMTLSEVGRVRGVDPRDAMMDIILAGDAAFTSLITSEQDIRVAIQEPWVAFGTDGVPAAPDGPLSGSLPHPRAYGTFPRVLGIYVRELGLLSLEDAVRKMTSLPAQILGLRDRGLLREGFYADIVLFDSDAVIDKATYENPHRLSIGVHTVVVNGEVALDAGEVTAARPGMVVRGPGYRAPTAIRTH